ncbi:MAG: hypothetical protein WBW71_15440 [Bacteroidota bacterium]
MKFSLVVAAIVTAACNLSAQTPLDSPEMEQTLSAEVFSNVVKSVWDVIKKGADDYQDALGSRNEFETSADFDARLEQRHQDIASTMQTFFESKKIGQRFFAVWMQANLVKYDADAQIYTVTSPTQIVVPPSAQNITTACPQNPYIVLSETDERGYKFAHLLLKTKPEYTWHVDKETARKAKNNEANMFFKVWFRFDVSQAFTGNEGQMIIVPVRIALMNRSDNITFWSDDIIK